MKIALSFPGCHPRGGVERLLLETANFLARRGHEVHVLACEFDAEALDARVVRHWVPTLGGPSLLTLADFARRCPPLWRGICAEVSGSFGVVCPSGGVLNVQSVLAAWLETSRRIRDWGGRLRQACNPAHPFLLALERLHLGERRYRKLTAPAPQVKEDLMRLYGVPERDITLVPNGFCERTLNAARCEELRPGMRRKLGLEEEDFAVAFVGNEFERKGFEPLLRAVAAMGGRRLHVLALGRAKPGRYEKMARELGLDARVHFVGSQSDVAPYFAAADALALPTQYEAWGMVIVEALACGTPVLTSRLAGAAVTVAEGRTGELLENPLDVDEIVANLGKMVDRRGEMGRQSVSKTVERYAWNRVLADYEAVLTSV